MYSAVPLPTVPIVTSGAFPTPVSPEKIRVERIYFQNGLLRANISWTFENGSSVYTVCLSQL
jgi:hypothetical protein